MRVDFTKMHGLGNDFVVIDATQSPVELTTEQIRRIATRRFGVGCDQLLRVEQSDHPQAEFRYRIFNADGGEVEQCGNGARCFARFVRERGLTQSREIPVITAAGLIRLTLLDDGQVTVDMGQPRFELEKIPFEAERLASSYQLNLGDQRVEIGAVSMGNPHAVMQVEQIDTAPVSHLGPRIEGHERFPNRVNAGFMQIVDSHHIRLRVYERGVGETLACGSGACAAVAVGVVQGLLRSPVEVTLPGGKLQLEWPGPNHPILMTGPATSVFEGRIEL